MKRQRFVMFHEALMAVVQVTDAIYATKKPIAISTLSA
jgi:hypothetical protein